MTSPKKSRIDPALEKAISKLLKDTMASDEASLSDKVKIIDRALKLEAIKHKMVDEGYGSGFFAKEEDEQPGG